MEKGDGVWKGEGWGFNSRIDGAFFFELPSFRLIKERYFSTKLFHNLMFNIQSALHMMKNMFFSSFATNLFTILNFLQTISDLKGLMSELLDED